MQSYDKNLSCANVYKEKDAFSVKTFIKIGVYYMFDNQKDNKILV